MGQVRGVERNPSESLRCLVGLNPTIGPSGYSKDQKSHLSLTSGKIKVVPLSLYYACSLKVVALCFTTISQP